MKAGDLVRHRDRQAMANKLGVIVNVSKHRKITLIDVYWSRFSNNAPRTVCGYVPNELVVVNEGR